MSIRRKIRDILLSCSLTRELMFFLYGKKVYKNRVDKKIKKLLDGKQKLSGKKIDNLIVSLTSFPARIGEIKYTLYSLLTQTVLPEKIILYLAESQFPQRGNDIPQDIAVFLKFNIEIHWCEDIKSYRKLIPTLENYPDYFILTADDDIYYKKKWLEKIWEEHIRHPDALVCHIAHRIVVHNSMVLPYSQWKKCITDSNSSRQIFGCGCGLFHKKYLYADINRKDLFMQLAPYADDIWFYFMALLNNTQFKVVNHPFNRCCYVNPEREYGISRDFENTLYAKNVIQNQNDVQFNNIVTYYGLEKSICNMLNQ